MRRSTGPKKSLLRRALLANAALVGVTLACLTVLFVLVLESSSRRELHLRAEAMAGFLGPQSEFPLLVGDQNELLRLARNALSTEDVLYVILADASGTVTQAARPGFPIAEVLESIRGGAPGNSVRAFHTRDRAYDVIEGSRIVASRDNVLDWKAPQQSSRVLGAVRVGISTEKQRHLLRWMIYIAVAVMGAAVAVMILFHFFNLRRLLLPLRTLIGFTQRVGHGDLTQFAPVERPDEVGDLAMAFNQMVKDLGQSREEMVLLLKEAQEANRLKGQFLANMSHEIRTPMNGVIGFTDLALNTELSELQREYLQTVKNSADALMRVIDDILDLSKIEAGRLDLNHEPFRLRECVESAAKTLLPMAKHKGLELSCEFEPGMPDQLVGDAVRLRQVLLNLAGNAIKFTAAGAVKVRVDRILAAGQGPAVHFAVSDTGIGIPADKQKLIFEPFRQVDGSSTRIYGGTGLGLAISARLVEIMGGRIWVESEVGRGSTFHFTARFNGLESPPVVKPAPVREARGDPGPLSILVVEDNLPSQQLVLSLLREAGHGVTLVGTGRAALAAVASQSFDLILMDVQMPELDGLEATREIRRRERVAGSHVPILAMTAHAMQGDKQRCLEAGMNGYLAKPIRAEELLAAIGHVAALRSAPAITFAP